MYLKKIDPLNEEIKKIIYEKTEKTPLYLYEVNDFYLVIFKWGFKDKKSDRNLWKLNSDYEVVWKIASMETIYKMEEGCYPMPYTGLQQKEEILLAGNFSGVDVKLDFETGEIEEIPGQRPW